MICPRCKLENPEDTMWCDCGYDFSSGVLHESNLNKEKLWNPNNFVVLSILFSFLPTSIFYAINFGRISCKKKRNIIIIASIVIFVLVIFLAMNTDSSIARVLFFGLNIGLGIYMRNSQKEMYAKHIETGGRKASYVVPMICNLIFAGLLVYCIVISSNIPDKKITINGDEIYYTSNVKVSDVNSLRDYLQKIEFFQDDDKPVSVKMDKTEYKYIISFVIDEEYINNNEVVQAFTDIKGDIANNLFKTSNVEVDLCDNYLNVLRIINN